MSNKQQRTHLKRLKRKKKLAVRGKISPVVKRMMEKEYKAYNTAINLKLKKALGIPESEQVDTKTMVEAVNLKLKKIKEEDKKAESTLEEKSTENAQ